MNGPLFFAKILLFGEYGIIKNSRGLSIPFKTYHGSLTIPSKNTQVNNLLHQKLLNYIKYLKTLDTGLLSTDWEKLKRDLVSKIYFDSSIPQEYGVGSSGALVAAIYDRYALNKIEAIEDLSIEKLLYLKKIFSQMESFFHGQSSGLDPLNSYLSSPILINSSHQIETTRIPSEYSFGKGAVFLIDSGISCKTTKMMSIFIKKMKNKTFSNMIQEQFINYSDTCIEDFLNGNLNSLFKNLKSLSSLVVNNFEPMIPSRFHNLWHKGIETNQFYFKLCGSGGGGFILGFTEDFDKVKKVLKDYSLELVYHF